MAPTSPRAKASLARGYEEYHPYGTTAWWAGDSTIEVSRKRYRYTGKEKDEETGLYYHGARYYAPWLGRWTSADPIGLGDGVNRYAYVHANPVRGKDPTGMGEQPMCRPGGDDPSEFIPPPEEPLRPASFLEASGAGLLFVPIMFLATHSSPAAELGGTLLGAAAEEFPEAAAVLTDAATVVGGVQAGRWGYAAATVGDEVAASAAAGFEEGTAEALGTKAIEAPLKLRSPPTALLNGTPVPPTDYLGGWHGTSDVTPKEAVSTGLPLKGTDTDLLAHKLGNPNSAFRGTTPAPLTPDREAGAAMWISGDSGWVYDIRNVPTWRTGELLEGRRPIASGMGGFGGDPLPGEMEGAIPARVPPENIAGYRAVEVDLDGRVRLGNYISNPGFRGPR